MRSLTLVLIVLIFFPFCDSKDMQFVAEKVIPSENSLYSGFKGTFSISDNGAVNYDLPLPVTPGVAGMTPHIAISYNSNNSASLLGEGWALSGFSLITRSPNTICTDDSSQAINFSPDDKLSLDGMRLVKILKAGSYGEDQTQYRTEHNSFKKISIEDVDGENLNGIKYFRVLSKDGIDRYYGTLNDDDVGMCNGIVKTNTIEGREVPYLWLLTLAKDKNGNWIKYNYNISNNSYRPKTITYGKAGGNTVIGEIVFTYYENAQTFPGSWTNIKYINGEKIIIDKPLWYVTSRYKSGGNNFIVRQYDLLYDYDPFSNRLFVTKIWQRAKASEGSDDTNYIDTANAIIFDWVKTSLTSKEFQDSLTQINKEAVSLEEDYKIAIGDFNGDGFPDKMMHKNYGDKVILVTSLNNGNGRFSIAKIDTSVAAINTNAKSFTGDFNADGKTDFAYMANDNNSLSLFLYSAVFKENRMLVGFILRTHKDIATVPAIDYKKLLLGTGDFNSDGFTDLMIYFIDNEKLKYQIFTSKKGQIIKNELKEIARGEIPDEYFVSQITDINADGISDILFSWTTNKGWFTKAFIFRNSKQLGILRQGSTTTDLCPSCLPDYSIHRYPIDTTGGKPTIKDQIVEGDYSRLGNVMFADLNKDGNIDILISNTSTDGWTYYYALGKGNGDFEREGSIAKRITDIPFFYNHRASFGDFNGDGFLDLVVNKTNETGWFNLIAYGNGTGSFRLKDEGIKNLNLLSARNFSYSQIFPTDSVLPFCVSKLIPFEEVFKQGKLIKFSDCGALDHRCWMKNLRLNYPVETGYYPNKIYREYDKPIIGGLENYVPKSLNFDNNVKRIINADYFGDSIITLSNNILCSGSYNYYTKITYGDYWQPLVVDLNGDGLSDLLLTYPRQVPNDSFIKVPRNDLEDSLFSFAAINQGEKPNYLNKIVHSNKNIIKLKYKSVLTNTYSTSKFEELKYPFIPYHSPIYTIAEVSVSNGIGLDSFKATKYIYCDGVFGLNGRGFIGFQTSKVINGNNNNYSLKEFWIKPEFLEKGLMPVKRSSTYVQGIQNYISQEEYNYDLKNSTGKIFNLYNTKQVVNAKDLLGIQTSHSETTSQYDLYGNLVCSKSKKGSPGSNEILSEITNTYYEKPGNDWEDKWLLGRLHTSTVNTTRAGKTVQRISKYAYNEQTGQLRMEVSDTQNTDLSLTKVYKLNSYGNIDTSIVYPTNKKADNTKRITATEYSEDKRFVVKSTDPGNYITWKEVDPVQGLAIATTFADGGNRTIINADILGRFITTHNAESVVSRTERRIFNKGEFSGLATYYSIDTNNITHSPTFTYFNNVDKIIAKVVYDFKKRKITTEFQYDEEGNLSKESLPFFDNERKRFTTYEYDQLNRKIKATLPDSSIIIYKYYGLTDTVINSKNQKSVNQKNILGELEKSMDNNGFFVLYQYDALGRVVKIADRDGRTYSMEYDLNGNRTKYTNPNFKKPEICTYDAFGNKISSVDPNQYPKYYTYDKLNRLIELKAQRPRFHETITYTYIQQSDVGVQGKGKILSIQSHSDDHPINERFSYYPSGQLKSHMYSYNDDYTQFETRKNLEYIYTYDKNLVKSIQYPYTGYREDRKFTLYYDYTNGILDNAYELQNGGRKYSFWKLSNTNALAQVTEYQLGDSIKAIQTFDSSINNLVKVEYGKTKGVICGFNYDYDELGNLIFRQDVKNPSLADSIYYDGLNRITAVKTIDYQTEVEYYDNGDVKQKTFGNEYRFNFSYKERTNQFSSIKRTNLRNTRSSAMNNIAYDNNGNQRFNFPFLQTEANTEIEYNQYNLPFNIGELRFSYAFDGSKIIVSNNKGDGTIYLGNLSELNYEDGSFSSHKINVLVNGKMVASYLTNKKEVSFLLKDALNTIIGIADTAGSLKKSFAFDVWGLQRRSSDWRYQWEQDDNEGGEFNSRGFLNNLSFASYGLSDFKARMYDPLTGRFIGVDPILSNKYSTTQFLNSYLYCQNNPTVFVDANGKFFWVAFAIAAYVGASAAGGSLLPWEWNENWWKGALIGAISVAGGYAVAGEALFTMGAMSAGTAVASGAAAGFAASFTATLVNGGNFAQALENGFKGGIVGGVTAGVTFGIGDAFGHNFTGINEKYFAKAVTHGLNQGISSEALGGSFEHGFLAGSFTSLATPLSQLTQTTPQQRIVISAMVGGTASALGGGKFANGAISGAMVQIYNDNQSNFEETNIIIEEDQFNASGEFSVGAGLLSVDNSGSVEINSLSFEPKVDWGSDFSVSADQYGPKLSAAYGFGLPYVAGIKVGVSFGRDLSLFGKVNLGGMSAAYKLNYHGYQPERLLGTPNSFIYK